MTTIPAVPYEELRFTMVGAYFTEWRIDRLKELLQVLVYGDSDKVLLEVAKARIWYDQLEDYHMLAFEVGGLTCNVSFYKLYSCRIGEETYRVNQSDLHRELWELRAWIVDQVRAQGGDPRWHV